MAHLPRLPGFFNLSLTRANRGFNRARGPRHYFSGIPFRQADSWKCLKEMYFLVQE